MAGAATAAGPPSLDRRRGRVYGPRLAWAANAERGMADPDFLKFATLALHAGQHPDPEIGTSVV